MKQAYNIHSPDQLPEIAGRLLTDCAGRKIFSFWGEMGAGKTTLIAALCRHLGVHEHVSSPTFAIINEYRGDSRIYHIDLFRVETLEEALALGIEDYLAGDDYCFIEWPQLIKSLLPPDTVEVHLSPVNEKERLLTLTIP